MDISPYKFLDFNKNQKYIKYSNNLVIPNPVTIKDLNNHSNKEFNFISVVSQPKRICNY